MVRVEVGIDRDVGVRIRGMIEVSFESMTKALPYDESKTFPGVASGMAGHFALHRTRQG